MLSANDIYAQLPSVKRIGAKGCFKQRLKLADGFVMSLQASNFHYCEPREDEGPYSSFEIGYPSEPEELLLPYAEEPERPTDTVYGYVPASVIEAVVAKHGGLSTEAA